MKNAESKRTGTKRRKIGRLVLLVMAVSFALTLAAAHLFLHAYIRNKAEAAIRESAGHALEQDWDYWLEDDTERDTLFEVVSFVASSGYTDGEWDWGWEYYSGETQVIDWCLEHPDTTGKIVRADIGGQIYYIHQIPFRHSSGQDDLTEDIRIFCVNVTSALWMISMTEILLAVIMAVCTAAATWIGCRTDRTIEREQEKQKRFFENASHELKTPLMSIRGFTEGLQQGIITDEAHALNVIAEETNKMTGLVDDILALSKADRGLDELKKEKISVAELVGDCLDTLEAEIRKRDLRVELHLEDRFIFVDIGKMKRAVTNILANGIRYAKKEIRISFSDDTLRIRDDGRLLSEDELQHMFERFHTGAGGSTGIGMALAKEITEQHGFQLSVENGKDGVCFAISMRTCK